MKRTGIIQTIALTVLLLGMYSNYQVTQSHQRSIDILNNSTLKLSAVSLEKETFNLSVLNSTVIVSDGQGHASGVVVDKNVVITAGHCIDHNIVKVICYSGKEYSVISNFKSKKYDVGVLIIDGDLPFVNLGNDPIVLDTVYRIGTPVDENYKFTVSKTIVSGINRNIYNRGGVTILDTQGASGYSGCPVFSETGLLVGIHVASDKRICKSVVEPVSHIKEVLEEYKNE